MEMPRSMGFTLLGYRMVLLLFFFFRLIEWWFLASPAPSTYFAPCVSTVLELVRRSVMNQYPGLMPMLYPGEPATVPTSFLAIDDMLLAFQVLAVNKTPAISGEKQCSLPPIAGLSLQPQAMAHRAGPPPRRPTQDTWVPLATLL